MMLNLLRLVITAFILLYSCFTDIKVRRAPNELWYILGGIGLAIAALDIYLNSYELITLVRWVLFAALIYVLVYIMFRLRAFGGADAKALIALAIVFPYYPFVDIAGLSLPWIKWPISPVFSLSVLGNAVIITLIVPITLLIRNLLQVPFSELRANPIGSFTGYRMKVESIRGKHVRLMHRYEETDGEIKKKVVFGGHEVEDETASTLIKWKNAGKIGDYVWVTPKLPFLIPITVGFLAAAIYGDIMMQLLGIFFL